GRNFRRSIEKTLSSVNGRALLTKTALPDLGWENAGVNVVMGGIGKDGERCPTFEEKGDRGLSSRPD
ncbi:MAG: hypothetical protein JXD19_01855, partial [Deltaproteobacteria bacterium]|nr:hypothetical protein [Deltaproteobacteria bacterium]